MIITAQNNANACFLSKVKSLTVANSWRGSDSDIDGELIVRTSRQPFYWPYSVENFPEYVVAVWKIKFKKNEK